MVTYNLAVLLVASVLLLGCCGLLEGQSPQEWLNDLLKAGSGELDSDDNKPQPSVPPAQPPTQPPAQPPVQPPTTSYDADDLVTAAGLGDEALVETILDSGVSVDAPVSDGSGMNALMGAAAFGNDEVAQLLLDEGANVDATDSDGWTALMYACAATYSDMVQLLLDNIADYTVAESTLGITALHISVERGDEVSMEYLLAMGADPDVLDYEGWSPFMYATYLGDYDVVLLFINYDANVNSRGGYSATPLIIAAGEGYVEIIELLLYHGAQVNAEDDGGWTALAYAYEYDHEEAVYVLEDAGGTY